MTFTMPGALQREDDSMPRRIGRYDVLGELGHGGMAVVYRARDPQLEREVAVKVLHPHLSRDEESRARFAREARAAARLRHPNIVEVYEFSEESDAQSFMVTELLSGPTLRRFIEAHPEPPAEVVAAIGWVLCDALECAHRQGVVHRDVKPDNLMLQGAVLKLTDFGIAHVADMREMTATGQVLGSPAHMAPEQIEGTRVDARTDVFATGTVLYSLACGRLPFDGPNAHSLLRKILDGEFADPLRVAPRVGHRFAAILRQAMARVPADRFESARALQKSLEGFLAEVDGGALPEVMLKGYFSDPEGATARLRQTLLAQLPRLGEAAQAQGALPEAMGYFNRALSLDPGNTKVLGLLRRAARKRALMRQLRAAGLIAGAALATAAVGLAVVRARPPVRPEIAPLAEPVSPPGDDRVTPVVRESERAVPAVEVDAGGAVASADAGREAPRRAAVRAARVERVEPPPRVVQMREVTLVPRPMNVHYSVNGGPMQEYDSRSPPFRLPVGERATIVVAHNQRGWDQGVWAGQIPAGESVFRVLVTLRPRQAPDDTATLGP